MKPFTPPANQSRTVAYTQAEKVRAVAVLHEAMDSGKLKPSPHPLERLAERMIASGQPVTIIDLDAGTRFNINDEWRG